MVKEPVLEMKNICKSFSGNMANDHVNLTLYPGEVHALLGENGAGKSTLMNILMGIYYPNSGSICYRGQPVRIRSPKEAMNLGIGMVHQHFRLIENLTVAENIYLYLNRNRFWLNHARINELVEKYADTFNLPVLPGAKISQISIGEQQRVEILKLLIGGSDILILDEPTAVLTPLEAAHLFTALRKMAIQGKSVLFITHKMSEVMQAADRITVLRAGRTAATMLTGETTARELVTHMIGKELVNAVSTDRTKPSGKVTASLEHVETRPGKGRKALRDVSLEIHEGEILGIAGVSGNGQNELAEVFAGLSRPSAGTYTFCGSPVTGLTPKKAIRMGIAYIPEDRMGTGLAGRMNLAENYILKSMEDSTVNRHGFLDRRRIDHITEQAIDRYHIQTAGIHTRTSHMSGGNIQKLLVAREISMQPRLIVATYPVHGLDVGAVNSIHEVLLEEKKKGTAILLISEDLEELFQMSDRIAVMYDGRIMDVLDADQASLDTIGSLMTGQERREEGSYAAI